MLEVYGEQWWDAAIKLDSGWEASSKDYVNKLCESWQLRQRKVKPPYMPIARQPADLQLPSWRGSESWDRSWKSFHMQVDNQLLADWCNGHAVISQPCHRNRANIVVETLAHMILFQGWKLKDAKSDWIHWVPRHKNAIPDALANKAMDERCNVGWIGSSVNEVHHGMNFVLASDGGSRSTSNVSAAGWVMLGVTPQGSVHFLGAGAIFCTHVDSLEAELRALELAVQALQLLERNGSVQIPHPVDIWLPDVPKKDCFLG